jgi:hypothetical protein
VVATVATVASINFNGGIKIIEKTNVYFIGSTEKMAVKIGKSKNPKKRLMELQTGNSTKLTLFGVIENVYPRYEKDIHELMDHIRIKGEWFKLTDELIHFMINKSTISILEFKAENHKSQPKKVLLDDIIKKLVVWSGDASDFITDAEIRKAINNYSNFKHGIEFESDDFKDHSNDVLDRCYRTRLNGNYGYGYYKINWHLLPDIQRDD